MSKQQGNVAEACFFYEASKKGLVINTPQFDQAYDCIVDNGSALLKVQIKSTAFYDKEKNKFQGKVGKGRRSKTTYTNEDADIIAIFLMPLGVWYFLPVEEVDVVTVNIYPYTNKGRWEIYRDNWEIFFSES